MHNALFHIFIFPGILFLVVLAFMAQFYDRKIYARFQNRVGPPWFQPVADFIKLAAKECIIPEEADPSIFKIMPVLGLASVITAFLYIPLWGEQALYSFTGDVVVVIYLLTIPTLTLFLGGWYSCSLYSTIGSTRSLTQLFSYEIPLLSVVVAAALLANTWSLTEIVSFYDRHPLFWFVNLPGFFIAIVALMGKLEKGPFDIPEAETEVVAGTLTEYSGKLLALFRLMLDAEMVVGASLLAAVFMPFGMELGPVQGFALYIFKIWLVISVIALFRTVLARLRIDQMVDFCWKYMAPVAFLQIFINLAVKAVFLR
jgi:NADH-quinone oxidoreductase subunit H